MKRLCLCLCLVPIVLLCGCGTKTEEKLLTDFSAALSQRKDLSFVGKLRCEYDDRSANFTLQYKQQEDGCKISVLQPAELEGLSVSLDEKGSLLEYGELFIDTGDLDHFGLSPLSALPKLADSLRGSHIDSICRQGDVITYCLVPSDTLKVNVSFSQDMTPIEAELISEGRVRVFCQIESWR